MHVTLFVGEAGVVPKLIAVALYLSILVGLGFLAAARTRSMRDYYAGGKRFGFLAAAFSARATGESAWLLLGLTGFGAVYGLKGLWIVLGELLGVGLAWLALAGRFKLLTDRYDAITVPDYLETRFRDRGHGLRMIAAFTLTVFVTIYVSAQIHATGEAFSTFLGGDIIGLLQSILGGGGEGGEGGAGARTFAGWDYFIGAILGFLVVVLYVARGGFVAVVWSDVFQGVLMALGLIALPIIAVISAGGLSPIMETLREHHPDLLSLSAGQGYGLLSIISIIALVAIGLGFLGSPQVFVRFISLKSTREIPRGAAVAIIWTLLADTAAVLAGVTGRAILTGDLGTGGQDVLPQMVAATLPAFFVGLYIAIVLSAIMSTADSLLVVASSAAVRDFYQKTMHPDMPEDRLLRMSRVTTVVLALGALAIAITIAILNEQQGIFWFVIFGWSGIAATFCPTIILSLFWKRFTCNGAKAAMVAGFLGVPIFKFVMPQLPGTVGESFATLEEMAPSFALSMVVGICVSLVDKAGQARIAEADDLAELG